MPGDTLSGPAMAWLGSLPPPLLLALDVLGASASLGCSNAFSLGDRLLSCLARPWQLGTDDGLVGAVDRDWSGSALASVASLPRIGLADPLLDLVHHACNVNQGLSASDCAARPRLLPNLSVQPSGRPESLRSGVWALLAVRRGRTTAGSVSPSDWVPDSRVAAFPAAVLLRAGRRRQAD